MSEGEVNAGQPHLHLLHSKNLTFSETQNTIQVRIGLSIEGLDLHGNR
jgi:hypothetical protein